MLSRRQFIALLGAGGIGLASYRYWPDEGIGNPCLGGPLPRHLAEHEIMRAAWDGVDPGQYWDCHVHLLGAGDSGSGIWVHSDMDSLLHPPSFIQKKFYLNAGCSNQPGRVDAAYLERLMALQDGLPRDTRLMLLAFDYHHDEAGNRLVDRSSFHVPNSYARDITRRHPGRFEWMASIHPYRRDAVQAVDRAARDGARAVKWLPAAMGIDPASSRCDNFYEAMVRHDLPLLTHAGTELAVMAGAAQSLGNPLRLRRPLEHGVRVIVAHCASHGSDNDLDKGIHGPRISNFELFSRLMDEPRHEGRLFGEISAMTQINRVGAPLATVIRRSDWHNRLINGSDYPLPGVMPLFSMRQLIGQGYIGEAEARIVSAIRRYNPLLFDFALKRTLRAGGSRLAAGVFHSRRLFRGPPVGPTGSPRR